MPRVAESLHGVDVVAMPFPQSADMQSHAQPAKRLCEALAAAFDSRAPDVLLPAILLNLNEGVIHTLRGGTIDAGSQIIFTAGHARYAPFLVVESLAKARPLPVTDVAWFLATGPQSERCADFQSLRRRFADVAVLTGQGSANAPLVARHLTVKSDSAHRLCTMIDVVSLLCAPASSLSIAALALRTAISAVIVTGWPHGGALLLTIAKANSWNAHPKSLEAFLTRMSSPARAGEQLVARGVLLTIAKQCSSP